MNYELYLMPGDTLVCDRESLYFHRDMKYKVSKCYQKDGKVIVFMFDKYGNEIPKRFGTFKYFSSDFVIDRIIKSRLNFIWDSCASIAYRPTYKIQELIHFKLIKAHFSADSNAIACIEKSDYQHTLLDRTYIYKVEDFHLYFKNNIPNNDIEYRLHIDGIATDVQNHIDFINFLSHQNFPILPELSTMGIPEYNPRIQYDYMDKNFQEFLWYPSSVIYDKPVMDNVREVELIKDIMILFRDLPSSHGSTSVAKILYGKSKISNKITKDFEGKYNKFLRYEQMFELASIIESYLFHVKIFMTKEDYSSGTEWRGAFEFIGSKHVDTVGLNKCLEFLDATITRILVLSLRTVR